MNDAKYMGMDGPQSAPSSPTSQLLVHDANWNDSWILHVLPNES
jgi:hypothetical protein